MSHIRLSVSLAFSGLLALSFSSCRVAQDSSYARIKTLDSIASGTLNLDAYQCKGTSTAQITDQKIIFDQLDTAKVSIAKQAELRTAVKDYISALPPSAETLFLQMGGQVLITSRASEICAAAHYGRNLDESKGEKTDGCFQFANDPAGRQGAIFTIIHTPDAKKIRYYGPQIFGYMYAQFYSRLTLTADKKGLDVTEQESLQLIALKERVANAFLADILATKDYKIEVIKNLLGEKSDQELKNKSIEQPLERLSALKDAKRRSQFLDYVYANSFQSAHCNSKSLEVARTKFKKSTALFREIDAAVVQVSAVLTGASTSLAAEKASAQQGSFSLANEELSLVGGDFLSSIMPMLGSLFGMSDGAGSAGGVGGIAGLFRSLMGGGSGSAAGTITQTNSQAPKFANGMFTQLSSCGCKGGSCKSCKGSCAGGNCSSCANGSCGPSAGSCVGGSCG